jgi:hypothetical protein
VIIFFEEGMSDINVKKALANARRVRRLLREGDAVRIARPLGPAYDRSS